MSEAEFGKRLKHSSRSSSWKVAIVIIWLAIAGVIAIYSWVVADPKQIEQVQKLRKEMDSLSNRGYQLQHKIDSLDRLGVADVDLKDTIPNSATDTQEYSYQ